MEVIERPVSPTGRITTWLLLFGLLLTLAWLTFGRLDVVASAPGKLIPAQNVKLIQPPEAGVVREILVRDGQHVKAGQPLVELDPTASKANSEQARKALESAELDAARARAVLSALNGKGFHFTAPVGTALDIAALQEQLAEAQLADIRASAAGHSAELNAATASRSEAQVEATKLTETLPLLDEQLDANEKLLSRGFVPKLKVIEMRRQRMAASRDRDAALERAKQAAAQMARARTAVMASREQARVQIMGDLAKAENEARMRHDDLAKALNAVAHQRLVSPVSGTVTQLAVHTIGGVVEATKPIMVIVPDGGPLVADVMVLNKDIGFVRPGQAVALKLDAFPFTQYGTVHGRIESISSDAVENDKLGLVYSARVHLDDRALSIDGRLTQLAPGMSGVADIRIGRRTIASYIVSPLSKVGKESGREK
ncbi:HlyD family type I secretion periplasmic adaptor subunit [Qipengyuania algicida]|uniref:HlyD family type I secretion periplasmic adaptor subunit n=1 Tax=Qipengyuania algicida TaxID=1836209 RepID=UPI001928133F|nr:HlyD family type I secretion periplasmic adaptor subunit [Qipengyuania algicida]